MPEEQESQEKAETGTLPPSKTWVRPGQTHTRSGDLVLLVADDQKRYLIQLRPDTRFHCHLGTLEHNSLIGQPLGATVVSQLGRSLLLLEPSLSDLMSRVKRCTQIVYPKDAAYLVHRLNLRAGSRVIETGTGSGSLTIALAWAVAPTGTVYTYEARPDVLPIARSNILRTGLAPYVEMHQKSIDDGFLQSGVDALVLDVREPWHFLTHVRHALRPGGFFASILPTTNQVCALVAELERQGFADIAVEELLLRSYKPVPDRLRPQDTMNAHTGYLIFARLVIDPAGSTRWLSRERKRYRARQITQAQITAEEQRRIDEQAKGGRKYPRLPLPG